LPAAVPDQQLAEGVRKVAHDLQSALEQFRVDSRLVDLAERKVPDARQRLAHVIKLTDEAAHHTMDLVDQSCPLVDSISEQAAVMLAQSGAGPELLHFLNRTVTSMQSVRGNLSEVLLAQGYQDLSGQIIRGVIKLVDELELALGELVRIADLPDAGGNTRIADVSANGHGPVVPGIDHGPAVSDQCDVDAMLTGLGL
jgi:chemotaxis protein CheZ